MHSFRSRRIALWAAVLAAWIAGSTFGALEPEDAHAAPLFQIERAHTGFVPTLDGSKPIYVLLIGSDARPTEDVAATRADSLHIVSINPAEQRASIVGFPRDAFVEIPGHGSNKINSALFLGGPELVVETVEGLTGLTMDYWALTGFVGFVDMIEDVDGLVVDVPFTMVDLSTGGEFQPGKQRLEPTQALAYARERKSLPQGDFGRSENQGTLIVSALKQFQAEFGKDPSRVFEWIAAFVRNGQSDVPFTELMDLAFTGTTINRHQIDNVVLPGSIGMAGTMSIVTLDQAVADAIFRDLKDDGLLRPANVPPSPNAELLGGG